MRLPQSEAKRISYYILVSFWNWDRAPESGATGAVNKRSPGCPQITLTAAFVLAANDLGTLGGVAAGHDRPGMISYKQLLQAAGDEEEP